MARWSSGAAKVGAEVSQIRSLGIAALRARWRAMFNDNLPAGLTKDIIARMIAYRTQEEVFGGLDKDTIKILDRLARGDKPGELNRRLKPGTVLVREYKSERHTVTVVPEGFVWQGTTYASLSIIARAITGTSWNGPRFFGLRMPANRTSAAAAAAKPVEPGFPGRNSTASAVKKRAEQRSHGGRGQARG